MQMKDGVTAFWGRPDPRQKTLHVGSEGKLYHSPLGKLVSPSRTEEPPFSHPPPPMLSAEPSGVCTSLESTPAIWQQEQPATKTGATHRGSERAGSQAGRLDSIVTQFLRTTLEKVTAFGLILHVGDF